ncbi:bifunctional uroporphyrinogen-III synthetase/response regulator domain protein [Streptomonospora alba]|uniref:Bifunctional uroporphyrinogen-III synthetase/response regulator domain protein n=1 Tax=Streptomonospora alba TaxID=183763 RepID=A0A0C2JAD8_9ACTN|nr:uroporphyrinogen-III synthase [Streptomonospora alba]KIH98431.1 bifunctional uroporphyrinogen-III synthetase/response regulator domain protein [Streptomonospora alba]
MTPTPPTAPAARTAPDGDRAPGAATVAPLAGFTVAVTASRRAEELAALLRRKGAEVASAPALRIVPLSDDQRLAGASRELTRRPADVVVATTGIGFRGWVEACDTWGCAEDLVRAMGSSRVLARGPKAKGAIRAAGLKEEWSPPSESSAEVLDYLLESGVDGLRVAVQLHGDPLPDFCAALRMAGAEVVEVPVYRWTEPEDTAPLDRLIEDVAAGGVDAVTFTSAPAASSMLARARLLGADRALVEQLCGHTLAMCVGPVTARPLMVEDIPTVWPERARMGAMVKRLAEELPERFPALAVAGHRLRLRGHAVLVDGAVCPVSPALMRVMRELARRPGQVRDRADLLASLGGDGDAHAVETAVARLRSALGDSRIIQTVVKRGYRLALDSGECAPGGD